MEDRDHKNLSILLTVVDAVRKSLNQTFMHVAEDSGMPLRIRRGGIEDVLDCRREPRTQAGAMRLVPIGRLVVLVAGLSSEHHGPVHRRGNRARAWALISSQGTTSSGL